MYLVKFQFKTLKTSIEIRKLLIPIRNFLIYNSLGETQITEVSDVIRKILMEFEIQNLKFLKYQQKIEIRKLLFEFEKKILNFN